MLVPSLPDALRVKCLVTDKPTATAGAKTGIESEKCKVPAVSGCWDLSVSHVEGYDSQRVPLLRRTGAFLTVTCTAAIL